MKFTSGAKSSEEAPRYDLIPVEAVRREAARFALGAAHHGEGNYQRGAGDPAFLRDRVNHLLNHALLYASGDRSDDHLAAIRANAAMLIWLEAARVPVPAAPDAAAAPVAASPQADGHAEGRDWPDGGAGPDTHGPVS